MTGAEVYEAALAIVPELRSEAPDIERYALNWINLVLAECFETENSILFNEGKPLLEKIPSLNSLSDTIPYHDDICRIAIPYGIVEHAFTDDDNDYRANKFRARFVQALKEASFCCFTDVVDVY